MRKLALIDIDGVVADNTERMQHAEERRQSFYEEIGAVIPLPEPGDIEKQANAIYWQMAFTPELVTLDTLIDGVHQQLDTLLRDGYKVCLLTSRPESMRKATEEWLAGKAIVSRSLKPFPLIMKTSVFSDNRIFTKVWKAGMVQTLASLYSADDILVVDDNEDVRQAVLDAYPDGGDFERVRVVASLAETVKEG